MIFLKNKKTKEEREKIRKDVREKILYFLSKVFNYPFYHPRNVTITLNYVCNQNCIMCDIKKHKFDKQYELTCAEIKNIIDDMIDLGIPDLVLTGGEPFLCDYIFDVIQYAKEKGLTVIVITNGFYDKVIVEKIIDSKVDHLQISLDGSTKEVYETIRGITGSFDIVLENIKRLIRGGKSVGTTVTVVRQNYTDLLNIAYLSQRLGCTRLAVRPGHVTNADPLKKDFMISPFWIQKNEINMFREIVEALKNFNAETHYIDFPMPLDFLPSYFENGYLDIISSCYIGFTRLIVSYNERNSYEVWMCGGMAGDIRKRSLKEIWYSSEARFLRKKVKKCKKACLFPELHEPALKNISTLGRYVYSQLNGE